MIRSYTPDDESAMLSLWNTAGAVMGYAPVPLEDFHCLLTRHPNFSPAYTFVLEERGRFWALSTAAPVRASPREISGDI